MQIGDPTPQSNSETYMSMRQLSVAFDRDVPTGVVGVIGTNSRDKTTLEVQVRGESRNVQLANLSPAVLAAIQTLTDAFATQLGV